MKNLLISLFAVPIFLTVSLGYLAIGILIAAAAWSYLAEIGCFLPFLGLLACIFFPPALIVLGFLGALNVWEWEWYWALLLVAPGLALFPLILLAGGIAELIDKARFR